ncbi:MAG: hypothetical protein KDA74_13155, partial [Planctomycetaceae bacterium]|nr:hypothetical protein [Planctomycetaceae bacterium]
MSIFIQCPQCRTRYRCKDCLEGEQVNCLKCHAVLNVSESATMEKQPGQDSVQTETESLVADSREVPWIAPLWDSGLFSQLMKSGKPAASSQVLKPKSADHFKDTQATSLKPSGPLLLLISGILFTGALLTFLL